MHSIALDDVTKVYPDGTTALEHIDLTVEAGELFSLVGPSGCGKTTVLRVLSGLEAPDSGRVLVGGRDYTPLAPHERDLAMITQDNQLLGNLTAARNIRFPLDVNASNRPPGNPDELVELEASYLHIRHLLDRKPSTLSEGERRVVQLARCIVRTPSALLMDEPFAYLEHQTRLRLRADIVRVHRDRGLTMLMATASQHDAMAMSDRIGVLFDGVLHQVGPPAEIYDQPLTASVAEFFGEPGMNVLPATVRTTGGTRRVEMFGLGLPVWTPALDDYEGRTVLVGIRPEALEPGAASEQSIEVRVTRAEPFGRQALVATATPTGERVDCVTPGMAPPIGTVLDLGVPADRVHLFDPATQLAISHPLPV